MRRLIIDVQDGQYIKLIKRLENIDGCKIVDVQEL